MDWITQGKLEINAAFASGPGSFSRLKLSQDDRLYYPHLLLNLMAVGRNPFWIHPHRPIHGLL